jgi:hypothetical protein
MKIQKILLGCMVLAALCGRVVRAQSDNSTTPPPTIQQRKENQQDRIANGVQSGQLTAGETKNLENKEANLNKEERNMGRATTAS